MMRARSLAVLGGTLALAACAHSPRTTLLTLDAAPPAPGAVRAAYRGAPVAIPAVRLPAVLDRAELVTRPGAGEVKVDDFARWSAPLGLLARDALVRDLTARLPAGAVFPPGATGGSGGVRTLSVTILALDTSASGARIDVAYRLLPDGPLQQASLTTPASTDAPADAARSFSSLLGLLADRIAAWLPG